MRVAYRYWMKDQPDRVHGRAEARRLLAHDRSARVPGRAVADRSGGLITLEVDSPEAAERVIAADPFVREELLEVSVVKPWVPE
ncbi:MAG TPA: YciI family protein [Actinomycetota bacterium]